MKSLAILAAAFILVATVAQAQGTLQGSVKDKSGGVLPGVQVVASNETASQKAITDIYGRYELNNLPVGSYTVAARLAGFVTGTRESVTIESGVSTTLDFRLCVAALEEIDWISPGGLPEAMKAADAVLRVRVTATGPVKPGDCPKNDFEHQAQVIETLKDYAKRPVGSSVTFVQENWAGERTPYPVGQEMVVFLSDWQGHFVRLTGPYFVFLLNGDTVVTKYAGKETQGMSSAQALEILRGLAKGVPANLQRNTR